MDARLGVFSREIQLSGFGCQVNVPHPLTIPISVNKKDGQQFEALLAVLSICLRGVGAAGPGLLLASPDPQAVGSLKVA